MNKGWHLLEQRCQDKLDELKTRGRLRRLAAYDINHSKYLDLTTNDYLGLQSDTTFQKNCQQSIKCLSVGSGGSRLLGGDLEIFSTLEQKFSKFKGGESALYFTSGYGANVALLSTLSKLNCAFFCDRLNHASIMDGLGLLSRIKKNRYIFKHNQYQQLESLLKKSESEINVIIVESIYSMDGDKVDLKLLANLADKYNGILVADEAHSLGCYGKDGNGLISHEKLCHENIISINPCGKAMGVSGSFIVGPKWLKKILINFARPFIFSTAPSPWSASSLLISIDKVKSMSYARERLRDISTKVREDLRLMGYDTKLSESHIIPIHCGSDQIAIKMNEALYDKGILLKPIRPPTVPEGESRLRLSLRADLKDYEINKIIDAFSNVKGVLDGK